MGLGGVAIAILPSIICLKLTFSDGLGGITFLQLEAICSNQRYESPLIVIIWINLVTSFLMVLPTPTSVFRPN